MAIDGEEWRELLDRFATKTDLEVFQATVERMLAVITVKLDQVVLKEMQAMILKQEEDWKAAATAKMKLLQEDVDMLKRNRLPPWVPNLTTIIGWILMLITVYFRPHLGP